MPERVSRFDIKYLSRAVSRAHESTPPVVGTLRVLALAEKPDSTKDTARPVRRETMDPYRRLGPTSKCDWRDGRYGVDPFHCKDGLQSRQRITFYVTC